MKKKTIYWLCDQVTPLYQERRELLLQKGFDVQFYNNINNLMDSLAQKRAHVVVMSDDLPDDIIDINMRQLSSHPNLYGVRMILSISRNPKIPINMAYKLGFRDIIPLDLKPDSWVIRFSFSTSVAENKIPELSPSLLVKSIAGLYIPARIVWLSQSRIMLEAKIRADIGNRLVLRGAMAQSFGVKALSLVVEKKQKTNLRYRFSDAYICHLRIPEEKKMKAKLLLDHLESQKPESGIKIFAAIKTVEMRNKLFEVLESKEIVLATALSKQHIISEPKYFGPHLVFIEDILCTSPDFSIFIKMLENLTENTPIVVIGDSIKANELTSVAPGRKIHILPKIKDNLMLLINRKYLLGQGWRKSSLAKDAVVLSSKSKFSYGEIYIPCRLRTLHPLVATLAAPINIGKYGLCRINSSLIRNAVSQGIYAKIVDTYQSGQQDEGGYNYRVEVVFSSLQLAERKKIGLLMLSLLSRQLGIKAQSLPAAPPLKDFSKPSTEQIPVSTEPSFNLFLIGEEVIDKVLDQTKQLAKNLKNSKLAESFMPLLMVFLILLAMAGGLYWMFHNYDPAKSVSGSTFSRELNEFQKRNK